jgi:hypothetical protein
MLSALQGVACPVSSPEIQLNDIRLIAYHFWQSYYVKKHHQVANFGIHPSSPWNRNRMTTVILPHVGHIIHETLNQLLLAMGNQFQQFTHPAD